MATLASVLSGEPAQRLDEARSEDQALKFFALAYLATWSCRIQLYAPPSPAQSDPTTVRGLPLLR
jgi:hypothetical protein